MTDHTDEQDRAMPTWTSSWSAKRATGSPSPSSPGSRKRCPTPSLAEFDRYIAAGDLEQAKRRIEAMQAKADQTGGYMGMYL